MQRKRRDQESVFFPRKSSASLLASLRTKPGLWWKEGRQDPPPQNEPALRKSHVTPKLTVRGLETPRPERLPLTVDKLEAFLLSRECHGNGVTDR